MGRVLEEVVLQELGLTGTGLILAGFQGYHVVERSHLHSCRNSSRQRWMRISRVTNQGLLARVITKVGRIPIVGRITVGDGTFPLLPFPLFVLVLPPPEVSQTCIWAVSEYSSVASIMTKRPLGQAALSCTTHQFAPLMPLHAR